ERVIRSRVDELGVAEPGIQKSGQERLVVELPGASGGVQQRAKDVIQRSAFLQFQIVRPASDLAASLARIDRAVAAAGLADESPGAAPAPSTTPGLNLFETADTTTDADSAAVSPDSAGAVSDTAGVLATTDQS